TSPFSRVTSVNGARAADAANSDATPEAAAGGKGTGGALNAAAAAAAAIEGSTGGVVPPGVGMGRAGCGRAGGGGGGSNSGCNKSEPVPDDCTDLQKNSVMFSASAAR